MDREQLAKKRGDPLFYSFGLVFSEGLVDMHGESAPARIARRFASRDRKIPNEGLELWREVFQAEGWSFDDVFGEMVRRLDEYSDEHAATIDSLPRLIASFERDGGSGDLRISVHPSGPTDWKIRCRLEPPGWDPGEPEPACQRTKTSNAFTIDRSDLPPRHLRYQLGIVSPDGALEIWEPWIGVGIPR